MSFKTLAVSLAVLIPFTSHARAIPDFISNKCLFHSVEVSNETIRIVLSGECSFQVRQYYQHGGGWTGNTIKTLMDHAELIFPRKLYEGPAFMPGDPTWDEVCKTTKSLEGSDVFLQVSSESELFKDGKLVTITCRDAFFHKTSGQSEAPKKKAEPSASANGAELHR